MEVIFCVFEIKVRKQHVLKLLCVHLDSTHHMVYLLRHQKQFRVQQSDYRFGAARPTVLETHSWLTGPQTEPNSSENVVWRELDSEMFTKQTDNILFLILTCFEPNVDT